MERDALQEQVTEQLVLISSLQIRLDEQRLLAEDVQKQTNTSLEVRIYDLENDIQNLRETVHNRDKTIKQLTNTLEQTKKRLEDREKQLHSEEEDEMIVMLRNEIQKLQVENSILEAKLMCSAQSSQILPNLVDNIIADKNSDIEKLREKLEDTQKQLEMFLSLNLDREQLMSLSQLKSSDRALSDMLSLADFRPDLARKSSFKEQSLECPVKVSYKRNPNETVPIGSGINTTEEISCIETVGSSNVSPLGKQNSTEIQKSLEKRVHFEDTEQLQTEILDLRNRLNVKEELIKEYSQRLDALNDLETNVNRLQRELETTEKSLQKATETFEKEHAELREIEKKLRVDLAEKKVRLTEKEQQLEVYEQDSLRKDQMYINLAKEKRELEKQLREIADNNERTKNYDSMLAEKNREIFSLEEQLADLNDRENRIPALEIELKALTARIRDLEEEIQNNRDKIKEKDEANEKLAKELENNVLKTNEEIAVLKNQLELKNALLETAQKRFEEKLADRDCEIEILNEDVRRYQEDLNRLENDLNKSRNGPQNELQRKLTDAQKEQAEKNFELVKIQKALDETNKEIFHLQEIANEKDRIIQQMTEDTKSLHVNLETIQNKIQESGNIVDLANRLRDQQKANAELEEEIRSLKSMLLSQNHTRDVSDMAESVEEIARRVGKELDYGAELDSSILSALGGGDVGKEEGDGRLRGDLAEVRGKLEESEGKLRRAVDAIGKLQAVLEAERRSMNEIQIEDAKLIEQIRIR